MEIEGNDLHMQLTIKNKKIESEKERKKISNDFVRVSHENKD